MILKFVDCFKNILDILFFFFKIFNECLDKGFFPDELKCAEVAPVYKKKIKRIRITTDLSVLCPLYQNYMKGVYIKKTVNILNLFCQSFVAVADKDSVHNTAFWWWSKNWGKIRDNKGGFAAVLTDLSKAFDYIPHGLLITKLNAFGFDKKSLFFIFAYLYDKKQKTKVGPGFIDFLNIPFGVPQGSILGLILFIIFTADLFFINNDIDFASYADDTTPYVCGHNFFEVINFLESNVTNLFKWFDENGITANSSKNHFLIRPYETKSIQIQNSMYQSKLL